MHNPPFYLWVKQENEAVKGLLEEERADVKESAAERRWQKSLKIYATEMPRKPHETKATSILMVDYNSCHIQIKTWEEILWSIIGPKSLTLLSLK